MREASKWGVAAAIALAVTVAGSAVSTADSNSDLIGKALYIEPGQFGAMKTRME